MSEIVYNKPYCDEPFGQLAGVNFPLLAPKSPGLMKLPISISLILRVISDGQSSRNPADSEQISRLKDNSSSLSLELIIFGNL